MTENCNTGILQQPCGRNIIITFFSLNNGPCYVLVVLLFDLILANVDVGFYDHVVAINLCL
jgi:hypothetical protein